MTASGRQRGTSGSAPPGQRPKGNDARTYKGTKTLKSIHDMDMLASPSRGLDHEKNLAQFDVQEQFWEYIQKQVDAYNRQYPSVMTLFERPTITVLPGTPEHLLPPKPPSWHAQAKDCLDGILHSVRKLREGLVASQRKDGLVSQEYMMYANWNGPTYVGMIQQLVQDGMQPSDTFLDKSLSSRSVFTSLWLLESLTSERPGHLQDYLQRRSLILQRQNDQFNLIDTKHLQLVHKAYFAVTRSSYIDLLAILRDASPENYWPRLLALLLCPQLRKQVFKIMHKAYLQIPIRKSMVNLVGQASSEPVVARNQSSIDWLDSMVFLNDSTSSDTQLLWWMGLGLKHKHWSETVAFVAPRLRGAADAHVLAWRP